MMKTYGWIVENQKCCSPKKKDYKLTPTTKKTLVSNRVSDIFQININYGRKISKSLQKYGKDRKEAIKKNLRRK